MSVARRSAAGPSPRWPPLVLVFALVIATLAPLAATDAVLATADHLVVSEVVTGGASASDELIELHNPTAAPLPLEGLEVVYVTATGATISRRAAWAVGAPNVPAGGHVLIANEAGIFAAVADATYATGMAATGGSVAIRILGAVTAIDAAGWGTAASAWMEGTAAPAPAVGSSIERLPGGAAGSGQDSGDNAVDFAVRLVPDPQNLASPPTPDPGSPPPPTPAPTSIPTPGPEPTVAPTPTPMPGPALTSIADARSAPDGTTVTIEAAALTAEDFHDGGGFVADVTGGIAVIAADGTFMAGDRVRITGDVDDRFSQRTLRADPGGLSIIGSASEPDPATTATGAVGEDVEGTLVRIRGTIVGSPTELTSGLAFDVDDGSGPARVVVSTATGIDTSGWLPDLTVELVGVAGQRDSTGSGTDGYRVLPRDPGDVLGVAPPDASPSPSAGADGVTSIADARDAARNAELRLRGVVTMPPGIVDEKSAVIQDASGAILLRLSGKIGRLARGDRVQVDGRRSTLAGMESLRLTAPIVSLGTATEPAPRQIRTGEVGEDDEALLVVARGAIVASARQFSSGLVSFEIDDGSGPLRVSLSGRLGASRDALIADTWVEVRGVLGQETTGSKPDEGYRIWPRAASEVRVTAPATTGPGAEAGEGADGGGSVEGGGGPTGSLDDLDASDLSQLRIGATLVVGRWDELGIGGLLWDGTTLVAVHASSGNVVDGLLRDRRPPVSLELGGLQPAGSEPVTGVRVVRLGAAADATTVLDLRPAAPGSAFEGRPGWASAVGRLAGQPDRRVLRVGGERIAIDQLCDDERIPANGGTVSVSGIAVGDPLRLIVPCGGVRAAPSVAAGTRLTDAPGRVDPAAGSASAALEAADLRRPLAAAFLLIAAIPLVVAALVRRFRPEGEPAPEEDGEPSEVSGARLTLVPVPHEGGP